MARKEKHNIQEVNTISNITPTIGHRPTDYRLEYNEIAERLVAAGFNTKDLAFTFGVTAKTIHNWKRKNPDFKRACNQGKEIVKKKLVAAGIKQALGYDYVSSKTVDKFNKAGEPITEKTTFVQHQAGNHNLLTFLLMNIARQDGTNEWQLPKQISQIEQKNVTLKIDGKLASEAIDRLAGKLLEDKPKKRIESKEIENG